MNIRILFYSLFKSPVQKSGIGPFFFYLRILQVGILAVLLISASLYESVAFDELNKPEPEPH